MEAQWQQDTVPGLIPGVTQGLFVDFIVLQDVSDSSQDRASPVLTQLQQRTVTLGPVKTLPLNLPSNAGLLSQHVAQPSEQNASTVGGNIPRGRKMSLSPSISPITPLSRSKKSSARPDSARASSEHTSTDRRDAAQYKPVATTVTTTELFGIGKRTKVEPVVTAPESPFVGEYLAMAMEDANTGHPRNASISTHEPDYQSSSPALSQRATDSTISSDAPSRRFSGSFKSFYSQRHVSAATIEVQNTRSLP